MSEHIKRHMKKNVHQLLAMLGIGAALSAEMPDVHVNASRNFRRHAKKKRQTVVSFITPMRLYRTLQHSNSRHGKCNDWIRENRRRRAAGVPQRRIRMDRAGAFIYDPIQFADSSKPNIAQ